MLIKDLVMRNFWLRCFCVLLCTPAAMVQAQTHSEQEKQADIERHRAMAAAHTAMAQCLASSKDAEQCLKELQTACKSLAIGKYCGMKHAH